MATGKKKQNVFADEDEELQPNDAFNKAVEAARSATLPKAEATRDEANSVAGTTVPEPAAPAAGVQMDQEPPPAASQPGSKLEKQKPDRAGDGYTKATYRVRNEATDAIEDMRLLLKRQYGIKALREEIVEEAILAAQRDLLENREASFLVSHFREPENQ